MSRCTSEVYTQTREKSPPITTNSVALAPKRWFYEFRDSPGIMESLFGLGFSNSSTGHIEIIP